MTSVIFALLCLITGCTTQKIVIKKMDWLVVFILAGGVEIASGITKGNAMELMGTFLSDVLTGKTAPFLIFEIFVIVTMLISNFITNSTAVMITFPIALSLCNSIGLSPLTFTLGIVFVAIPTLSATLADAQTAMMFLAGYKFSNYIRYTWLLDFFTLPGISFTVPLFFPLMP